MKNPWKIREICETCWKHHGEICKKWGWTQLKNRSETCEKTFGKNGKRSGTRAKDVEKGWTYRSTDVWDDDQRRVWAFKIFKRWENQSVKLWRYELLLKQIACRRCTHQMLGLPTLKPSNFRIKFRTWCRQNKIWYSAPEMEDVHQMMSISALVMLPSYLVYKPI